MEGFCRGCLIKYDEPMELLQYTEKNRRLFVYSTGLQVKRNDTFTFQLCKDCFLNMKQACKFKKNCRTSDKRFRNYIALKDVGDPVDFCTFLKNSDDTLTFRLPMASGSSTPVNQKCRDDDNESTCTSIRNFMTDLLQGEEMPDTEARIIKEVIEEEADLLDDSLDSHWLQEDMSIDTDFRLDFSFSQFSTPHTVNDDRCYTPKQKEDQMTFDTINTEKQTKILKDFTNAFKTDDNIEELSIFVGGVSENTASFEKLKELSPMGIDEIDGMEKPEIDTLKNKPNLKEVISDLGIDEIEGMDTSDSKIVENDQNFKELSDFRIQVSNTVHETESNQNLNELCNFNKDENDGIRNMAVNSNKSLKEMISNLDIEGMGKSDSQDAESNQILKELVGNCSRDVTDACGKPDSMDPKSNLNLKELCDFRLDRSGADKAENKALKNVKSLKELCDFSLDSFEDTAKSGNNTFKLNQKAKQFCNLSINDFDESTNSESVRNDRKIKEVCEFGIDKIDKTQSNLNMPLLSEFWERNRIDTPDFEIPKGVRGSILSNNDVSNSSVNIEAFFNNRPEKDEIGTPDFEITKGVMASIPSNNDVSNSSINIEAFFNDRPEKDKIGTTDFEIPKGVIGALQSNNDVSNSSINIETFLNDRSQTDRMDTPDFDIPKGVISSIQSNNDVSNSSINIEAFLNDIPKRDKVDTPDFDMPKGVIGSITSNYDVSNSSLNIEAFLNGRSERDKIDTPDFDKQKGIRSIQSINDISNSSINIEALLRDKLEKNRIETPDFEIPKGIRSIQSSNDISNSSINIEALLKEKLEKDGIDAPDFEIPKSVIGSIQSYNDVSNSSINIEALLKNRPEKDRIDTPDFELPKGIRSLQSINEISNSSINIEALLQNRPEKDRIDTPDFENSKGIRPTQSINDISNSSINIEALLKEKLERDGIDTPKGIRSVQSSNDISNSSINIEALLKEKLEKDGIDARDFEIPKSVIGSIQSYNDVSNSSINIEALLKNRPEKDRIDTPDFELPKGIRSIQSINEISNSSINIEALLKDRPEREKLDTPDFETPKGAISSIQSNNDVSNSSINIEALLKDKPCSIDKNLEDALKNTDNKEFSLEDILISPPVFPAASAASTPTITNILFGENLNKTDTNTKIEQCLESYHDVQEDIEIFEEFFQNDTKEFELEDIKRVNEGFKPGDWSQPAINDFKFANKENNSKNIDTGISIDDKDQAVINNDIAVIKTKKEPMIHISEYDENDKFNIKYLYCNLCKIRYDTSRAFSGHFAKKHNIKIIKPRKPNKKKNKQDVTKTKMEATINSSDTPANDKFDLENSYCKLCNIKYDTSRALSIHFAKTHHIKIEKPKPVKINKNHEIVCNNCGIKSRDHSNFARHMKKCLQKGVVFKCDRCQMEFTTQAHLEKHMTCHTKAKRKKETGKEFVCTICGAILHRHSNFVLHMRRHTKDYSAKCEFCDKGFYRQSDLKAHMRSHTGETEFACKFCPKLFTRRDVLLRHILIHLDERLFECDYCKKRFIKKYDLKKHIINESCRRKKKNKAVENKMDVDLSEEQEEVEMRKEVRVEMRKEVRVEVMQDVTVIYAKGSDATIKQQLPFLETERSN